MARPLLLDLVLRSDRDITSTVHGDGDGVWVKQTWHNVPWDDPNKPDGVDTHDVTNGVFLSAAEMDTLARAWLQQRGGNDDG
jgi:hypothetical protein